MFAIICRRTGVAKGLFYWYFDTKESLYAEMIRGMRQRLRRVQAEAMDPDANAVERIRQAAFASMIFLSEHPTSFAFMSDDTTNPALKGVVQEGREPATDLGNDARQPPRRVPAARRLDEVEPAGGGQLHAPPRRGPEERQGADPGR